MDKLSMHTPNLADENYRKLAALFPNAVTETVDPATGEVVRAIDKDVLMQEISAKVVDGREERYQFTWPDKKKAVLAANAPISATLRPVRGDSVGKDGTPGGWDSENLYIEGDNLDVLKLLRETYLGKVKMIYIDPPYNTGNDFVYEDDFAVDTESYMARSGQYDEQGNRLVTNTDSNGRFHTDWLNMIYPRLRVARDLLSDDGVIFISICEEEIENLHKMADEVFGRKNLVGTILWKKKTNGNNMGFLPPVHDYILCYAKNINCIDDMGYPVSKEFMERTFANPDNDPRGPWTTSDLSANHKGPCFEITNPNTGEKFAPPEGRYWVFNEQEVLKRIADGRIIFGKTGTTRPVQKVFAANRKFGKMRAESWWDDKGMNEDATVELKELFGVAKIFTHPKPTKLLKHILTIATDKKSVVLDFFSGSATTAHAVMKLNAEDGGHRKFIMVQLPEVCDANSEAAKAGYKTICEIGKERIRRAGKATIEECKPKPLITVININIRDKANYGKIESQDFNNGKPCPDIGFRVLRLDSSNMQDIYYTSGSMAQSLLDFATDNIKPDRTPEDLLFQVMLELGIMPSSPIKETTIAGKRVFDVADGFLLACFDTGVTTETVTAIAKQQPYYAVFRDSSMADDSVATNFEQVFETYSPSTVRKVL